jgi:hypothetical protein
MNRSALRIAIAILTVVTALIHLYIAFINFATGAFEFQPMFLLNALGYLTLLGALLLDLPFLAGRKSLVHYAFMAYTAVTILGWVAIGARNILGYSDKVVEVLLLAALWMHLRQTPQNA